MKDIAIFLGGALLKTSIGWFLASTLKNAINRERKELIERHVMENHRTPLKNCQEGECTQLSTEHQLVAG